MVGQKGKLSQERRFEREYSLETRLLPLLWTSGSRDVSWKFRLFQCTRKTRFKDSIGCFQIILWVEKNKKEIENDG